MDILIFAIAYGIILLGFIGFAFSDAEHDPTDYFLLADRKKSAKHQ